MFCEYISKRIDSSTLTVENYISTENMLQNRCGVVPASKIPAEKAVEFLPGDILISNIRPYFKKIWFADKKGGCSSDVLCFRALPGTDSTYLYYLLSQDAFFAYVMTGAKGSKMPRGDKSQIMQWDIDLPDINEQRRIASILKSIDDKIALNNRINHNLEEQAQALYKSWFIDFEPFKDCEFVDSELGMIPAGWSIKRAEDICSINIGKTPPRKESQWFSLETTDPVWVSISDMSDCGVYIDNSAEKLTTEAIKRFNVIIVPEDSVLLSFKLTIGRVAIANRSLTTNEAIARFVTNCKPLSLYLYINLLNYDYSKLGSTSSIATAVNSKIVKAMPILWPGEDVVERFSGALISYFDEIKKRQAENRCLAALRDMMLPKLMCGQLTC